MKTQRIKKIACIVLLIFLEVIFFRNIIFSEDAFGDFGDGRYCNLVTEHWYQVFIGNEQIQDTSTFYPASGSLGFSDTFLAFSVPHILFRVLGLNMFYAFKWTLITIHLIGLLAAFYFFHKKLKCEVFVSTIAAILFSFSNMQNAAVHPQLYVVYLLPVLSIFIFNLIVDIIRQKSFVKNGILSISILAIIFYSTGYVGYFIVIFFFIITLISAVCMLCLKKKDNVFNFFRKRLNLYELMICIFFGIIIMIPFLMLYLPISIKNTDTRQWSDIISPSITDFLNIPSSNFMWRGLTGVFSNRGGEYETGFTITCIFLFLLSLLYFIKKKKIKENFSFFAIGISTLISLLLIVEYNGKSLWYFIFRFFPGASTIRAVTRFNEVLQWTMIICIAAFGNEVIKKIKKKPKYILLSSVFLISVFETTWIGGITSAWKTSDAQNILNEVSPPPKDCEVMFIKNGDWSEDKANYTRDHLDAWMIAYQYNLKTLNGYGSYYPEGWEFNYTPDKLYELKVINWIHQNNLSYDNIYSYDKRNKVWEEVKGIEIENYLSEEIAYQNAEFKEGKIRLYKDGLLLGPYIKLYPSEYKVIIKGENLLDTDITASYNMGTETIPIQIVDRTDSYIMYLFTITDILEKVEFKVHNNSDKEVVIESVGLYEIGN